MRAALLLIVAFLSGCASTAVVPRSLTEVEARVERVWGHRREFKPFAPQFAPQIELPGGRNTPRIGELGERPTDFRSSSDQPNIIELGSADFRSSADQPSIIEWGVELTTLERTDQAIRWKIVRECMGVTLRRPLEHSIIEARSLDANRTRIRLKSWDFGFLFDTRNRGLEREMLERLTAETGFNGK